MKPNLDTLKTEIEHHLEESGMAVFYGYSRGLESMQGVYWDCDQYPDYRLFVKAAQILPHIAADHEKRPRRLFHRAPEIQIAIQVSIPAVDGVLRP